MFNRKKPESASSAGSSPRGRASADASSAGRNPLARRFRDGQEPDTVELAEPGRYHLPAEAPTAEPDTRETAADEGAAGQPFLSLITLDPRTGKFHLHPGTDAHPVSLNDVTVDAPTELRRGDRLQIGAAVFEFLP
jgi:hypothetical protein